MEKVRTILVTGFDPFGGEPVNPAWEAVKRLPNSVGNCQIVKKMIPTVASKAIAETIAAIEESNAFCCVSIGQAGGRSKVSIERVAVNKDEFKIPDNEGNVLTGCKVVDDGPDEYFSTLPIDKIHETLLEKDIPSEISNSAGLFVCNHLFYGVRHYVENTGKNILSGFIHVPYLPEQAKKNGKDSFMPLEEIVEALEVALNTISLL